MRETADPEGCAGKQDGNKMVWSVRSLHPCKCSTPAGKDKQMSEDGRDKCKRLQAQALTRMCSTPG